jgi:hypothetical protein
MNGPSKVCARAAAFAVSTKEFGIFGLGCASACAVTDGQLAKYRRTNNIYRKLTSFVTLIKDMFQK